MRHRFNPHERVNDYQRYCMLTILPLRSMSCTPRQFIFALSCKRRSFLDVLRFSERWEGHFEKFFVYLMITNVMMKTFLNQKIYKKIEFDYFQAVKSSACPKTKVTRRPIFFRKPNFPKFPNCGFNTRHDNREVTLIEFFECRICLCEYCPNISNIYRMFRSVGWTHDMIIVKWHLFIWHERKLCAMTNAPPVQSTQTGQWLSTLFHDSCSAAHVYVLHPGQYSYSL